MRLKLLHRSYYQSMNELLVLVENRDMNTNMNIKMSACEPAQEKELIVY